MEFWDKHKQSFLRVARVVGFGVAFLAVVFVAAKMLQPNKARADSLPKTALVPIGEVVGASRDWSGFYVGVHGGHLWGDWDANVDHPCPKCLPYKYQKDAFSGSGDLGLNGWLGGAQIGADKQFGSAVVGIVVDVSKGHLEGDHTFRMDYDTDWAVRTSIDWLGSARLRLGYAAGPVLLYATGGFAWARVETSMDTISITGPVTMSELSSKSWHFGHVIGAGAEWAFAKHWTLSLEYLRYDLGSANYDPKGPAYAGTPGEFNHHELMSGDLVFDVARGGINYRF
jgi:outer membrane immunogenic protein